MSTCFLLSYISFPWNLGPVSCAGSEFLPSHAARASAVCHMVA